MHRTLFLRLVILLSFLSIPNPEGAGLLILSYSYFAFVIVAFVFSIFIYKLRKSDAVPLIYFTSFLAFLIINFLVSKIYAVDALVWVKRTVHIIFIPAYYFIFRKYIAKDQENIKVITNTFYLIGVIEALMIILTYLYDPNLAENKRATSFNEMILYSIFMVFSAFIAIEKYKHGNKIKYLAIYFLIVFASWLTGSRILSLSIMMVIIPFVITMRKNKKYLFYFILSLFLFPIVISFIDLSSISFFQRMNLDNEGNLDTIESKYFEVIRLFEFFQTSPVFGVGYGKTFNTGIEISDYSYTHVWVMFNLGYGGLIGLTLAFYPIVRLNFINYKTFLWFTIVIFVFYLSNTSYTNLKHSMLIAFMLLLNKQSASLISSK